MAEEVKVDPDGSTTFEGGEESTMPPVEDAGEGAGFEEGQEEMMAEAAKGTDPAILFLMVVLALGVLYYIYYRKSRDDEDEFFSSLDGEKVRHFERFWLTRKSCLSCFKLGAVCCARKKTKLKSLFLLLFFWCCSSI